MATVAKVTLGCWIFQRGGWLVVAERSCALRKNEGVALMPRKMAAFGVPFSVDFDEVPTAPEGAFLGLSALLPAQCKRPAAPPPSKGGGVLVIRETKRGKAACPSPFSARRKLIAQNKSLRGEARHALARTHNPPRAPRQHRKDETMPLSKKTNNKKGKAAKKAKATGKRPAFRAEVSQCDVCIWDGILEVTCTKQVSGPGIAAYAVTNGFPLHCTENLELLMREMAAFGVTLIEKDGLHKACMAMRGKRVLLSAPPCFDGLCGELVFGRGGWEPTHEQAQSKREDYGFEWPEMTADDDSADAQATPHAPAARKQPLRMHLDLSAFTAAMGREQNPMNEGVRQVKIRSYAAHREKQWSEVTKVTRALWVFQRLGGYVLAEQTRVLRSDKDVKSLVREMAAFGVPLLKPYFLDAACEAMQGRRLDMASGVELDEMPPAASAELVDLSALLPTYP